MPCVQTASKIVTVQMPDRSGKPESRTIGASVFRQRPEVMAFITEEWPGFRLCSGLMSLEERFSCTIFISVRRD